MSHPEHIYRHIKPKSSLSGRLRGLQCALLGLYAFLLALVFPFICLGALVTPGHPHQIPHFVFAMPALTHVADDVLLENNIDHNPATLLGHHQHLAADIEHETAPVQEHNQPVGRSVPSLLLFSILNVLIVGAWIWLQLEKFSFAFLHHSPFSKSIWLPIPVPPPRLFTSQL